MTAPPVQYIFLNRAPGQVWNQNRPETISERLFDDVTSRVPVGTGSRRVGLSFIFSYLDGDPNRLTLSLTRILDLSKRKQVPVLIVLDGQNWWGARPELWNWWDPSSPGFDPNNKVNVEWTGWSPDQAISLAWRNWGQQIRVLPPPNLASPAFRKTSALAMRPLLNILRNWSHSLNRDQRWLFPGIKVGWEASVGINAYHYPRGNDLLNAPPKSDPLQGLDMAQGLLGGLDLQGFAAMTSMHRTHPGPVTKEDHEAIVADYLSFLARECRRAGFGRREVFTHAGGQYAPYALHVSHRVAINRDSLPGWSLYNVAPADAGDLADSLRQAKLHDWCAAEWLPQAKTSAEWVRAYDEVLSFRRCRFVCVYNWEGIQRSPEAIKGLVEAIGPGPAKKVALPGPMTPRS